MLHIVKQCNWKLTVRVGIITIYLELRLTKVWSIPWTYELHGQYHKIWLTVDSQWVKWTFQVCSTRRCTYFTFKSSNKYHNHITHGQLFMNNLDNRDVCYRIMLNFQRSSDDWYRQMISYHDFGYFRDRNRKWPRKTMCFAKDYLLWIIFLYQDLCFPDSDRF